MTKPTELAQVMALAAEALREAQAARAHTTELVSQFGALMVNEVLEMGVGVIDSAGMFSRDYRAPYAAVGVVNPVAGAGAFIVTNSPRQGSAPAAGAGVFDVPAGAGVVRRMAGTTLTIYGTAGARVNFTVFSVAQPETFGRVA
jgi:hypothetical protein